MKKVKVRIKVLTEEGRYCLQEIKGLKEGAVIEGRISDYNDKAIDITWQGEDAVLWLGENCVIAKKANRLPKGWIMDVYCHAVDFDGHYLDGGATRQEVVELMRERGYKSGEYEIRWVVRDYHVEKDHFGDFEGIGETRDEAIKDFWREVKHINKYNL